MSELIAGGVGTGHQLQCCSSRSDERALGLLLTMPMAGVPYPTTRRPGLRRLLLPKTQYHLYFCLERDETLVVIHSVWGVRRGRGPRL